MNCLIIGYGRAGKRHVKYAQMYELDVATVDPLVDRQGEHYTSLDDALKARAWDCAVIASPPEYHLAQLKVLTERGIPALCEKPLCGLGELEQARQLPRQSPVMLALNYRYHPNLLAYHGKPMKPPLGWNMSGIQHRVLPSWGLLLDHLSHDLFIVDWMSGGITSLDNAVHLHGDCFESWEVWGETVTGHLLISDKVMKEDYPRHASLKCAYGEIEIDANPRMFEAMWENFLLEHYDPGLNVGIRVQELLERVAQIGGDKNGYTV